MACPEPNHPGIRVLHEKTFPTGKASFNFVEWKEPAELPDGEYPLILNIDRILYHYNGSSMTRRCKVSMEMAPSPFIELNPKDAEKLNLKEGEKVRVTNRRASVVVPVKVSNRIKEGEGHMVFHYPEAPGNILLNDQPQDPFCKIPQFRMCTVRIEKYD